MTAEVLRKFDADNVQRWSPVTASARLEAVTRLAVWLDPVDLLDGTTEQLRDYQRRRFVGLARASVDIYTRHIQAFYRWAIGEHLISEDPAAGLPRPQVHRGRPHPTGDEDLARIFSVTRGSLRIAYVLAAFAGLRCGEICRLRREDLHDLAGYAFADVIGKGSKERALPLVRPVVDELIAYGLPRTGWVVLRDGRGYEPRQLSLDSHNYLRSIGVHTTMHSLRHTFATATYQTTRDILLLQRLLGHSSVSTTQIYAQPDLSNEHARLDDVAAAASAMLGRTGPAGRAGLRLVR